MLVLVIVLSACTADALPPHHKGLEALNMGDYAEALLLLSPLAEDGAPGSQAIIGVMHHQGSGVPQDYVEARRWFRLAAAQENSLAQYMLGTIYDGSMILDRVEPGLRYTFVNSRARALRYYRMAAQQGHPSAQFEFGRAYLSGDGVPQDNVFAYKWLSLASQNGVRHADPFLESVTNRMTHAQLTDGQAALREWKANNGS